MIDYTIHPEQDYPHQFKFAFTPDHQDFFEAIDWCFDFFTEDVGNERWSYWTIDRTVVIIEPGDALLFWTRWAK